MLNGVLQIFFIKKTKQKNSIILQDHVKIDFIYVDMFAVPQKENLSLVVR